MVTSRSTDVSENLILELCAIVTSLFGGVGSYPTAATTCAGVCEEQLGDGKSRFLSRFIE